MRGLSPVSESNQPTIAWPDSGLNPCKAGEFEKMIRPRLPSLNERLAGARGALRSKEPTKAVKQLRAGVLYVA